MKKTLPNSNRSKSTLSYPPRSRTFFRSLRSLPLRSNAWRKARMRLKRLTKTISSRRSSLCRVRSASTRAQRFVWRIRLTRLRVKWDRVRQSFVRWRKRYFCTQERTHPFWEIFKTWRKSRKVWIKRSIEGRQQGSRWRRQFKRWDNEHALTR